MSIGTESQRSERVRAPTPSSELERRWAAVREAMSAAGVDVLLVHNHVEGLGGYVKYFSDFTAGGGYPLSVVFPQENEPMTMITHGAQGAVRDISPDDDPFFYGVKRVVSTWSFATASYTARYDAEQIVEALRPYATGRVGIVGFAQIPYPWVEHLKAELPKAEFFDANDIVDPIKAVKSDYEQQAIHATAVMQVEAFQAGLNAIEPGRREWEVVAAVADASRKLGSHGGVLLVGSAPQSQSKLSGGMVIGSPEAGESAMINPPRHQNRVLQQGDSVTMLVEVCGEEGYFVEIARTIVLGSASDALLAEHEFAVKAWQQTADGLRPGAQPADVFADYNAFMQDNGRPPEQRLYSHGQGYDLVERPLTRSDEPMTIAEGMNIAVHPMYVHDGMAIFLCDNVLIGPDGASEPLHGVEQKIFEV